MWRVGTSRESPAVARLGVRWLLLDGFLHDRVQLARTVGVDPEMSDAELALAGYENGGESFFERLRGAESVTIDITDLRISLSGANNSMALP